MSTPSTESSELIGIIAAMVILTFVFGTVVAMLLPILAAILGLASTLSIVTILSHVTTVSTVAPTLATMIGLGVGIDYALFIVTRHFRGLGAGLDVRESLARAVATSGGAVTFAGGTVIIALVSLAVARIPLVTTLGLMAAIAVLVAVLAALTLLPALLAITGPHINSLRVRGRHPKHDAATGEKKGRGPGGGSRRPPPDSRWTGRPGDPHPAGDPAVLAEPGPERRRRAAHVDHRAPGLRPALGQLRSGGERAAADRCEAGSPAQPSSTQPAPSGTDPRATDPRLQKLEQDVSKTKGVAAVAPVQIDKAGTTAYFDAIATTGPSEQATTDLVSTLRSTVIPAAQQGTDLKAYVGGTTAGYVDLASNISSKLPLQILVVILLSFLLLTLAFRTVVIPVQAALMNVLSIGAAYGVLTALFQWGWLHGAIGLQSAVPIVSYVPLFMFAILFGLSMDYEVFLVSQIEEHVHEGQDNKNSVVSGLVTSGRVITAAATIMVFVFGSFVLNGDPTVKQFGIGLAVAVLLDATIVRCLLVPALMVLMGKANWYLPRWVDRLLPRISIEGAEYFQARDAREAAGQLHAAHPVQYAEPETSQRQ